MALGGHPLPQPVPALQAVGDGEGREGQRDQSGHAVADDEAEGRTRTDLGDGADEHAAAAGDRVLHLAALPHDGEHLCADGVTVTRVLVVKLAIGGSVKVERLDVDADLVGPNLRSGVKDTRGLRQRSPGGLQHAMHAQGRTGRAHD